MSANDECPRLGDVKDKYLSTAKGEVSQDTESDDEGLIDEKGDRIERSGGKIEIVKSGDGVGNIRNRFGNMSQSEWKSKNSESNDTDQVDANAVSSARNLFKNFENQNQGEQKSFNRPTSRKVRDAKQLMELRKKATYGDEDELPEDGVVKKSVVLDDEELSGTASRREAMNIYVKLQSPTEEKNIVIKPKNRLLSDEDAQNEIYKQSGSASGSENGDNGYEGSDSPCSPTSTMSDDYGSDTLKDHEKGKLHFHL